MEKRKLIGLSDFARNRHTSKSAYSHFDCSEETLLQLVEDNFENAKPGYRDGVLLVKVPPGHFYSGIVLISAETHLEATFSARREGEEPFVQVRAQGKKTKAEAVEIILYSHDVLQENNEAFCNTEWEIISINARATSGPEPLTPMAMARNMLELSGGTKATYSAEEFAHAIIYWSNRALSLGSD